MALSEEQKQQLDRLNEVFSPYSHLAKVNDELGEQAVYENMVEKFPLGEISRETMQSLSEQRQALLNKQSEKYSVNR